jgi:carbon-monoxide dehydrogenase medium subunit
MKPAPFRYARPETLAEVVALLTTHGGEATLLAGGQSLLPMLNLRLARPALLIDLALVAELRVLVCERDELVIGAGVRQRKAETSVEVNDACRLIGLALHYVGHVQTRSRGTIGGSLAYADPNAELPGVAVALDAELVAVGPRGRRSIAARDFFLGAYSTALDEDEVLTEVRVPVLPDTRYAFLEVGRRSRDAAVVGIAAAVCADNGAVSHARIAAIGVDTAPRRLTSAEEATLDGGLGRANRARIAAAAVEDLEPATDAGRHAAYRRRVIGTLVSRALAEVSE